MKCWVTPITGYNIEPRYRVKCVVVESERIFKDITIAPRNTADLLPIYRNKRQNLIRQYMEGPNFYELNRLVNFDTKCRSITTMRPNRSGNMDINMLIRTKLSKYFLIEKNHEEDNSFLKTLECSKIYRHPEIIMKQEIVVLSLINQLLIDIYGYSNNSKNRFKNKSINSLRLRQYSRPYLQRSQLELKCTSELQAIVKSISEHINHISGLLIHQLLRREYLQTKRKGFYNVLTAYLQAHSNKGSQDTRMKFSLMPQRSESGFRQWVDAMKMVAKLQGGIPGEFRRKLWLTLAERHLQQRGVDWKQAEKLCFNEWCNPDDNELGIQIIKDLHRTGCSLFCGTAGRDNQAVLRRVLLGFARWNKSVGYCQGLNVLAALILQVVDRDESAAVKVMIYLIEGVLPEGYFADSLKGLSIDMAVFRDLLHMHLPKLSKHLECLQNNNTKDNATGSAYEPPLTNVFTMQWFLTLFCHCLPPDTVLCVWDLIFLEGDDVLLRTALAIWKVLSDRIMTVTSANEFYSIMGVLTREMYEFTDTNHLVKTIVSMGTLHEVQSLRENHRYNTILWTKRINNNVNTDTEINERLAIATAATIFSIPKNRKLDQHSSQKVISNDRERLALDISMLKQQYSKLREHQRQAHIILTNACTQHSTVPIPSTTQAINHLLIGKNALTSAKNRSIGLSSDSTLAHAKITTLYSNPRNQNLKDRQQQGITINWKDMKKNKKEYQTSNPVEISTTNTSTLNLIDCELSEATLPLTNTMMKWSSDIVGGGTALDSDSDSTSTELCDEPDRLSDVDSEELKSTTECFINVKTNVEEESSPVLNNENSIIEQKQNVRLSQNYKVSTKETSFSKRTDQIQKISTNNADYKTSLENTNTIIDKKSSNFKNAIKNGKLAVSILLNDNFIEEEISTGQELNDKYLIQEINSTILQSFDIDCPTNKIKSTTSKLFGNSHYKEENLSKTLKPLDFEFSNKKNNSITFEFKDTHSLDDKNITTFNLHDNDKLNNENKLLVPLTLKVDSPVIKKELLPLSDVIDNNRFVMHKDSVIETATSIVENLDHNSHFLESENKIDNYISNDVLKNVETENICNAVNESVSVITTDDINGSMKSNHARKDDIFNFMNIDLRKKDNLSTEFVTPIDETIAIKENLEQNTSKNSTNILNSSSNNKFNIYKKQIESKLSEKSGNINSLDFGETMAPDSLMSNFATSPKTHICSKSHDFILLEKSTASIMNSDCKILTLSSFNSESMMKSNEQPYNFSDFLLDPAKPTYYEKSFNLDIQSSIDTNLTQYTKNYNYKFDEADLQKQSSEITPILSPFYSISNQNKKSSPCTKERNATSKEILEFVEYQGIQEPNMKQYSKTGTPIQAFDTLKFNSFKEKFNSKALSKDNSFNNSLKQYSCIENKDYSKIINDEIVMKEKVCNLDFEIYHKNKFKDKLQEIDIFSSLLGNKLNHSDSFEQPHDSSFNGNNEILQLCSKSYERSSVNLEKEFPHTILSSSIEDFTNTVKKQSCNDLEDLQFIEDEIDPNIVTKNTSFILEDLKNSFSKQIIGVPGIRISAKGCKTYIIEPKFNINDNSNSILKSITYSSSIGNNHDNNQGELKFGVWTKVKPRKSNDIGHRRSDRALKIIQENSAILQKILTCQTNKCLPDLEEVSKSITISPINEEISKIFSPILEKMGLNENKINLKELDRNTITASEFDAKIDDELSKLSLINDDKFDYLTDVDISSDYLVTRDAFIDYQINEELAKLLANYEDVSSIKFQKDSTNLNTIDDKSISPNMSCYKFANESLNNKNDHSLNDPVHSLIYSDNPFSYRPGDEYLTSLNVLTTNDIDIYSQFDKVNETSYIQHLPAVNTEINCQDNIIPITTCLFDIEESSNIDDATLIMEKSNYNISHKKIPYNITCSSSTSQTSKNDYKSKISQKKKLNNSYLTQAYDQKNYVDLDGFENSTFELASKNTVVLPTLNYECEYEKHLFSKENLQRHTRDHHNEDLHVMKKSTAQNIDLKFSSIETDNTEFDNTACYYSNTQVINSAIKYESNDDKRLSLISTIKTNNYKSNYQFNGYDISSLENSSVYNENDNRSKQSYNNRTLESKSQISSSLTNMPTSINHHQDIHVVLPHYHYSTCKKVINNTYATIPACFKNSSTKTSTTVTTITTPTSQITYSNTFMDKSLKNSTLTLTNFEENKLIIDDDTKSNLDGNLSSETCIINPISLKTSPRKPKELTLKLELHSSTK